MSDALMTSPEPSSLDYFPALYILFTKDRRHFRVAHYSDPVTARKRLNLIDWVNYEASKVVFIEAACFPYLGQVSLQAFKKHRLVLPGIPRTQFFDKSLFPKVVELLVNHLTPRRCKIGELLSVTSENPLIAYEMLEQQQQLFKALEARSQAQHIAENEQLQKKRQRASQDEWNQHIQKFLPDVTPILAGQGHLEAPAIEQLLKRLDLLSAGWLERNTASGDDCEVLDCTLSPDKLGEARRIIAALTRYMVFKGTAIPDENGDYPKAFRLFRELEPPRYPLPKLRGSQRFIVEIAKSTKVNASIFDAIKPNIRGWDLPLTEAHLDFHPSKSRRYGGIPGLPTVSQTRQVWDDARSVPSPVMKHLLEAEGVALDFELSHAVRYVDKSPWPSDNQAEVVLVRLATPDFPFVGYASYNLKTRSMASHFFDGFEGSSAEAFCSIWAEKPQGLVAVSFPDAVALNRRFRCPVVITPTPSALQAYRPRIALKKLVYALPSKAGKVWLDALEDAVMNIGTDVADVTCVEPDVDTVATTWFEHLSRIGYGGRVGKRPITFDTPSCDALAELTEP